MSNPSNKKPTSFDVAKLAGVHRSAVSRAFSEGTSISQETKEKVLSAAKTLGYRVNYLARGLQAQNSGLVGIVASRLDTSYRSLQVKLASHELLQRGFTPILLTADDNVDLNGRMSNLLNYNVSGMIITSDTPSQDIIEECLHLSVPVVLINRAPTVSGPDLVQVDTNQAGKMAFEMLRSAGATRFAVLEPVAQTYTVVGRARAFAKYCHEAGYPIQVIKTDGQFYKDGENAADKIHTQLSELDGIFCTTDLMAFGVLDRLRTKHQARIPSQVKLLGFDDVEQARWSGYNLSTIRQDIEESAQFAIELMVSRLENPDRAPQAKQISLYPVHRETT